jgi:DNA-binding LytR/AlgR family response regulator
MSNPIKILVVEDEMIIAAKISLQLSKLGYEVTGILSRGEEALLHVEENHPDIIIMDINLKGELDGIKTAEIVQENNNVAVIYLTANTDENTFGRAKLTRPHAFMSKPFNLMDLQRSIELTVERLNERAFNIQEPNKSVSTNIILPKNEPDYLSDRIFVKHKDKMVKLFIADILYISAERAYCQIFTKVDKYILSVPLKNVEEKLPTSHFIRIHRSYLVNILEIDEVTENHVFINKQAIPIGQTSKEDLMKRLHKI